jgi:hypothetical protein
MQTDFPNLYSYKQTNVETSYIHYMLSPLSFHLCLTFSHLCTLDLFFNPWSRLVYCPTLLVHAKQAIIETNPKSSTHVSFTICQICLLSHDAMISHNTDAILLILFALLSFAWTNIVSIILQYNNTQVGLHFNTTWNMIKLVFSLNFWYTLLCNIHVYAIYLISYSTLSKFVRHLIVLSLNSLKPTKGLDALLISPFLVIDDTIKTYKRLINCKILNPMI